MTSTYMRRCFFLAPAALVACGAPSAPTSRAVVYLYPSASASASEPKNDACPKVVDNDAIDGLKKRHAAAFGSEGEFQAGGDPDVVT